MKRNNVWRPLTLVATFLPLALVAFPAYGQFGPPTIPRPPMGPIGPMGPRGGFGGMSESVWTCSGCKRELGRGNVKPILVACPFCGARFSNGLTPEIRPPEFPGMPAMPGMTPPPNMPNGGMPAPAQPNNPPPQPPANNAPQAPAPAPAPMNFVPPVAPAPLPVAATGTGVPYRAILIGAVALGGGGLLVLGGISAVVYFSMAKNAKTEKRRPRKRVYHDDDED